MIGVRVFCTLEFEGFHSWPEAPEEVGFLRHPHRHMFQVRAEVEVTHDDRDVEFILLKRRIEQKIQKKLEEGAEVSTWSCEMWAKWILREFDCYRVEVSEDGENGAVVERV